MKTPEISWYNFTHPNQDAIEKRDKFLEEPINDCINCTHFHFNNDGRIVKPEFCTNLYVSDNKTHIELYN